MRKLILAALVAAIVLAVPANAHAAQSCGTRGFDFGRVTVRVAGATSCPFGWATYHAFRRKGLRSGRYPIVLYVRSPVTGKRYRLAQIDEHLHTRTADWRYTGVGAHGSTLDVRFYWVAY